MYDSYAIEGREPVTEVNIGFVDSLKLKCFNGTSKSVVASAKISGRMVEFATIPSGSSLNLYGKFPHPLVFRDAESTEEALWVRRHFIFGSCLRSGKRVYGFVMHVIIGVLPLKDLAIRCITPHIRCRKDILMLELPEPLKEKLRVMKDRLVYRD